MLGAVSNKGRGMVAGYDHVFYRESPRVQSQVYNFKIQLFLSNEISYWYFFSSAWRRPFISTCGTGFAAWLAGCLSELAIHANLQSFATIRPLPLQHYFLYTVYSHLLINSLERNQTPSVLFKVLFKDQVTRDLLVAKSLWVFGHSVPMSSILWFLYMFCIDHNAAKMHIF